MMKLAINNAKVIYRTLIYNYQICTIIYKSKDNDVTKKLTKIFLSKYF